MSENQHKPCHVHSDSCNRQGMLPQLANTTFYFSAADFPAVEGLVALTIDDGICRGE